MSQIICVIILVLLIKLIATILVYSFFLYLKWGSEYSGIKEDRDRKKELSIYNPDKDPNPDHDLFAPSTALIDSYKYINFWINYYYYYITVTHS